MARLKWLIWGAFFSLFGFVLLYFVVYQRVISGEGQILSPFGLFFSNIWNVIIFSLVLGILLGLLTSIETKKKTV